MEPETGAAMRREHLRPREPDPLPDWVVDGRLWLASLYREVREREAEAHAARCRLQRASAALLRRRPRSTAGV